jgi:hypothetical protein
VVREWLKKQKDVGKQKKKAYDRHIEADERFAENCRVMVKKINSGQMPPVEMFHASNTLKTLRQDRRRRRQSGKVSDESGESEAGDEDADRNRKTMAESRISVVIRRHPSQDDGIDPPTPGPRSLPPTPAGVAPLEPQTMEQAADEAQQDAEIAPPALNASGLTRPERLQRPASGAAAAALMRGPAEVDSHMLLDEETEFQLSRHAIT